jgi:hypothetical protein
VFGVDLSEAFATRVVSLIEKFNLLIKNRKKITGKISLKKTGKISSKNNR